MAENAPFPYIAEKNWWKFREQLQRSASFTASAVNIKSLIGVGSDSAARNIIRALQRLGLIDADGKPTELANKWRLDPTYVEACREILEKVYPEDLRSLFDTPQADPSKIAAWMMDTKKVGKVAAEQYARTYLLLLQENIRSSSEFSKAQKPKTSSKEPSRKAGATRSSSNETEIPDVPVKHMQPSMPFNPQSSPVNLHIDLQIHISPEATGEQIDQIFSSIAKHLHLSEN